MSALDIEARAICAARAAWWDQLRAFNANPNKTGADAAASIAADDAINARVERLRRAHFPRAARLIVSYGEVLTASKTGRSIRRVWGDPMSTERRTTDHDSVT